MNYKQPLENKIIYNLKYSSLNAIFVSDLRQMKKISFLGFILLSLIGHSTPSKEPILPLSSLIGHRIFESPLSGWLEKNGYATANEVLQENGPILFVRQYERGYSMMFDINMVLNSISLYKQGDKFKSYKGALPLNLKFGMKRDSLYQRIDLKLSEVEDNPYALTRNWNNTVLQLMFNSLGLSQVNIISTDTISKANDLNFVRLVSNGILIAGDCDSLHGKMSWNEGKAIYEGQWKNNMPHGKGYFIDEDSNWYRGDFKYGFFWGKGQMNVAGYYNYDGEFIMSRRQGYGMCKFTLPKDEIYEGDWDQDNMHGLGRYITTPQHFYYGNMRDNKFNGRGKLVMPDGWMEGVFKDGLPNGAMQQFIKKDNTLIEGKWIDGKREGKFKLTNMESKKVSYRQFVGDIELIDK